MSEKWTSSYFSLNGSAKQWLSVVIARSRCKLLCGTVPNFSGSNVSALLWTTIDSSNGRNAVGFCSAVYHSVVLWIRSGWSLFWDVFFLLTSTLLGDELARFWFFPPLHQDPEDHNMQFLISLTNSSTHKAADRCPCLTTKQNSRSIALLIGLNKTSVFFFLVPISFR